MSDQPLPLALTRNHISWTVYAFLAFCLIIVGLIVWQLWGMTPNNWCFIAKEGAPRDPVACYNVLVALLSDKDHFIMIMLGTLALIVVGQTVVVNQIFIRATGPNGTGLVIGKDNGGADKAP